MTLWQQISRAAILGTQREPWTAPASDGPLGNLLAKVMQKQPSSEAALLSCAAVMDAMNRAGLRARVASDVPMPSDDESATCCTPQAASYLARILAGEHGDVLGEFLTAVARARHIAPPEYLPDLLDQARSDRDLRPVVAAVAGKRGPWLAAQSEQWTFLLGSETLDDWETAPKAARPALLRKMRQQDPAGALAALTRTWDQEAPEDRAEFVAALELGLGPADEPFLDAALDDRRKEVRRGAAALLARMPQSALCQRMLARVEGLLAMDPGEKGGFLGLKKGRKAAISVTLPAECDKAMARDGVEAKPPADNRKLGEKAWWLLQMLAAVPPSTWSTRWQKSPAELIELAAHDEWSGALLGGWTIAAWRHADIDWSAALLWQGLDWLGAHASNDLAPLAMALPSGQLDSILLQHLQQRSSWRHDDPINVLLHACRHDWSPVLTKAVLQFVATAGRMMTYVIMDIIKTLGLRMHPQAGLDAMTSLHDRFADAEPAVRSRYEDLVALLQFRRDSVAAARA